MDYLERSAEIAAKAQLSEKETELFISLTNPLLSNKYEFTELYELFKKLVITDQGKKACELYKEKQEHYETEPSAFPELNDDVRIG